LHIFPVDNVDQGVLPEGGSALGFCAYGDGICQAVQVIPLLNLVRPCVPRYTQGRDHKHTADA